LKVVTETIKKAGIAALGTFDGVHLGHQQIIRKAQIWAAELGLPLTVITFINHPQHLFGKAPSLLMGVQQKERFLSQLGVDQLLLLDFTPRFAQQTAAEFIAFLTGMEVQGAVVGYNYTFGKGGTAGPKELSQAPFPVKVVNAVEIEGSAVSSSRIRQALREGDLKTATQLLARPYSIEGTVVAGQRRGRTFGIPTANIAPDRALLLPKEGVYIVRASGPALEGRLGVLNLGPCPTFDQRQLTVELFLPQWQGDLYGQELTVEFIRYLRCQRRFPSPQALVEQIEKDLAELRKEAAVWENRTEHC
jgi:riboflavin kinase/FMN adenylyltransferase